MATSVWVAVTTAKSAPAVRVVPEEGRIFAVMVVESGVKVVPLLRIRLGALSVAVKVAEVKDSVSGN